MSHPLADYAGDATVSASRPTIAYLDSLFTMLMRNGVRHYSDGRITIDFAPETRNARNNGIELKDTYRGKV